MQSSDSNDKNKIDEIANIIDLTKQNLEKIPFEIPNNNSIFTLFLSHNRFKEIPENIEKVNNIILSFNNYDEIPSTIISSLIKYNSLKNLDFSYNNIQRIPDEIFKISSLKKLKVFHNRISSIQNIQNENLTSLDIGHNHLQEIPTSFPNLTAFHADHNLIKSLSTSFNSLTKLCLSRNEISSISKNLFFPELLILDLSGNKISELPDISSFSPKLKTLDASFNSLKTFPVIPSSTVNVYLHHNSIQNIENFMNSSAICANLSFNKIEQLLDLPPFLVTLDVSNNGIKNVNPINSENIKTIDFSMNLIEKVVFVNCVEMHFSFNRIRMLDNQLSEKITVLEVDANGLYEIPVDVFMIPTLLVVSASFNQIKKIPENIVESNVKRLNLSFNPIEQISNLPVNIEHLSMNHCKLSSLPSFLRDCRELVDVSFVGNEIKSIENLIPKQIQFLNLANNELNRFCTEKVSFKDLKFLDLSSNLFESFDDLFANVKCPNLSFLNLSFNPVKQTLSIPLTLKLRRLILSGISLNEEIDFSNMKKLRYLDVSNSHFLRLNNVNKKAQLIQFQNCKENVSSSNHFGRNEANENYILMEKRGENYFYGIFSDFDFMKNKVLKKLDNGFDNFSFVNDFVSDVYRPFALLIEASRKFFAAICGNFQVVSVGCDGGLTQLNEPQNVQEIYDKMEPSLVELKVPADAKFIVLSETRSLQAISKQLIENLAQEAKNAAEFAQLLKTVISSFDKFHNVSVIAIDFMNCQ